MIEPTLAGLVNAIRESQLLLPDAERELDSIASTIAYEPHALADELVKRNWLTPFQAQRLLENQGNGLVLGPYILLESLGIGGMGQVFKARHLLMNRVVALKVIRPELLSRPELLQRFHREIQAAAQVSHPNIVIAHDASEVGGVHFLVMEYVEGSTLARILADGPLPIRYACDYIRQAALGLQHVHERGLVHRDVKPSNLLLTASGSNIKILDMGLARLDLEGQHPATTPDPTQSGVVMGTPDYMSPEQALDPRQADIRSDIYSLGCTFYHCLTGQPPFPGGTLTQKLLRHQQDEPIEPSHLRRALPTGLSQLVRKMMAKSPADRFSIPGEIAAALASYCGTSSVKLLQAPLERPPEFVPDSAQGAFAPVVRHEPSGALGYDLADSEGSVLELFDPPPDDKPPLEDIWTIPQEAAPGGSSQPPPRTLRPARPPQSTSREPGPIEAGDRSQPSESSTPQPLSKSPAPGSTLSRTRTQSSHRRDVVLIISVFLSVAVVLALAWLLVVGLNG